VTSPSLLKQQSGCPENQENADKLSGKTIERRRETLLWVMEAGKNHRTPKGSSLLRVMAAWRQRILDPRLYVDMYI
jgi:hypothetical protein